MSETWQVCISHLRLESLHAHTLPVHSSGIGRRFVLGGGRLTFQAFDSDGLTPGGSGGHAPRFFLHLHTSILAIMNYL